MVSHLLSFKKVAIQSGLLEKVIWIAVSCFSSVSDYLCDCGQVIQGLIQNTLMSIENSCWLQWCFRLGSTFLLFTWMLLTSIVCVWNRESLCAPVFSSLNDLWRDRLIIIYDNIVTYKLTQRAKKINNKTPYKSFVRMCKEKQIRKKEITFISEKLLRIFLDWRGKDNSYLLWQWWDLYN